QISLTLQEILTLHRTLFWNSSRWERLQRAALKYAPLSQFKYLPGGWAHSQAQQQQVLGRGSAGGLSPSPSGLLGEQDPFRPTPAEDASGPLGAEEGGVGRG